MGKKILDFLVGEELPASTVSGKQFMEEAYAHVLPTPDPREVNIDPYKAGRIVAGSFDKWSNLVADISPMKDIPLTTAVNFMKTSTGNIMSNFAKQSYKDLSMYAGGDASGQVNSPQGPIADRPKAFKPGPEPAYYDSGANAPLYSHPGESQDAIPGVPTSAPGMNAPPAYKPFMPQHDRERAGELMNQMFASDPQYSGPRMDDVSSGKRGFALAAAIADLFVSGGRNVGSYAKEFVNQAEADHKMKFQQQFAEADKKRQMAKAMLDQLYGQENELNQYGAANTNAENARAFEQWKLSQAKANPDKSAQDLMNKLNDTKFDENDSMNAGLSLIKMADVAMQNPNITPGQYSYWQGMRASAADGVMRLQSDIKNGITRTRVQKTLAEIQGINDDWILGLEKAGLDADKFKEDVRHNKEMERLRGEMTLVSERNNKRSNGVLLSLGKSRIQLGYAGLNASMYQWLNDFEADQNAGEYKADSEGWKQGQAIADTAVKEAQDAFDRVYNFKALDPEKYENAKAKFIENQISAKYGWGNTSDLQAHSREFGDMFDKQYQEELARKSIGLNVARANKGAMAGAQPPTYKRVTPAKKWGVQDGAPAGFVPTGLPAPGNMPPKMSAEELKRIVDEENAKRKAGGGK